jgi:hypothetical protein
MNLNQIKNLLLSESFRITHLYFDQETFDDLSEENMEEEKLEEGTFVISTSDAGTITGEICGTATTEMPGIGYIYIIKIMARRGRDWSKYPYSCCALPRSMLKVAYHEEKDQPTLILCVPEDAKALLKSLLEAWYEGDLPNWMDHNWKHMREICNQQESDTISITADTKNQFKGQCAGCYFVAAKCANDDEADCPYFAPAE